MDPIIIEPARFAAGVMLTAVIPSIFGFAVGYWAAKSFYKPLADRMTKQAVKGIEECVDSRGRLSVMRYGAGIVLNWLDNTQPQQLPPQAAVDIFVEELQEPREMRRAL